MLPINGTSNYIHLLIGIKPSYCLSDLVREIKKIIKRIYQRKEIFKIQFPLAGRFWGIFIWSITIVRCNTIY